MNILLTNDDGIDSPGLLAQYAALREVAEVSVVAPERNQSGVGRAISIGADLCAAERRLPDDGIGYAVSGTPVDCVRMAHLGLIPGPIAAVVAGINLGQNLGEDVTYSGTVGAAIEGVLLGLPAIGVSQRIGGVWHPEMAGTTDFEPVARFTAELLVDLLDSAFPPGLALNINAPETAPGHPRGARLTRLTRCVYRDELEQVAADERGRHYRIYGRAPVYLGGEGTDSEAVSSGTISVTPIGLSLDAAVESLPPSLGSAIDAWAPEPA